MALSYGFAPNIVPSHIPNPARGGNIIGWTVGGNNDIAPSSSWNENVHYPIRTQIEIPCQAIFVPDEDMPNYPFKFQMVSQHYNLK